MAQCKTFYMAEDGRKMEFKWKVNANVSYLHSSYSFEQKTFIWNNFFSFDTSINYGEFDFIVELWQYQIFHYYFYFLFHVLCFTRVK